VYVEPYPKSLANELFSDALGVGRNGSQERVRFEPFVGVGARRYFDLFSMKQGVGRRTKRKGADGLCLPWRRTSASLRTPALEGGFEDRERVYVEQIMARVDSQSKDSSDKN
jgi:cytidine deaminase